MILLNVFYMKLLKFINKIKNLKCLDLKEFKKNILNCHLFYKIKPSLRIEMVFL